MENELPVLERTIRQAVEASSGDGTFTAILASEGEASDGHILSIRGLETRPSMPMLFGHYSSEQIPLMGSIRKPTKTRSDGLSVLRVEGRINLNGDGVLAEVRRGINQLIVDGDLEGMSLRASTTKAEPRRNLSKDHPAFVNAEKLDRDDPKRWGYFISRSAAVEGSIVAIGADPKALIGRADAAGHAAVQTFFRSLSETAGADEQSMGDLGEAFTVLRDSLDDVRDLGVDDHELAEMMNTGNLRESVEYTYTSKAGESLVCRIPRQAYDALRSESLDAYRGAIALHADFERKLERLHSMKANTPPAPKGLAAVDPIAFADTLARKMGETVDGALRRATGQLSRRNPRGTGFP